MTICGNWYVKRFLNKAAGSTFLPFVRFPCQGTDAPTQLRHQPQGDLLMSNPAPIVIVKGRVHAVRERYVQPAEARPEVRDPETGRIVTYAREARDGYTVHDVLVLTDGGGFADLLLSGAAAEALGGTLPSAGDEREFLVRTYVAYKGVPGRRYATAGLSIAGDLMAERDAAKTPAGRREPVPA